MGNDTFVKLSATDGILLKNIKVADAPAQIEFVPAANTPATIGGDAAGTVQEDVTLSVTKNLTISDPDPGQAAFTPSNQVGTYGSLSINAAGQWTYTLNNAAPNVQALNTTDTKHDLFVVSSVDGTTKSIDVSVKGLNDAPVAGDDAFIYSDSNVVGQPTKNLLTNDTDPESNPLSVTAVTGMLAASGYGSSALVITAFSLGAGEVAHYELFFNDPYLHPTQSNALELIILSNGTVKWENTSADIFQMLPIGQSLTLSGLTYTVSDGKGGTDTADISLTFNGATIMMF